MLLSYFSDTYVNGVASGAGARYLYRHFRKLPHPRHGVVLDPTIPAHDDDRGLWEFHMPPKINIQQRRSRHEAVPWRQAGSRRSPAWGTRVVAGEMPAGGVHTFIDGVRHPYRGHACATCLGLAG